MLLTSRLTSGKTLRSGDQEFTQLFGIPRSVIIKDSQRTTFVSWSTL